MACLIQALSSAATGTVTFCSEGASKVGSLGSYTLSTIDKAANHRDFCFFALKLMASVGELVAPTKCVMARDAAFQLANVLDILSYPETVNELAYVNDHAKEKAYIKAGKSLSFGIVGVAASIFVAADIGIINLEKATRTLSQYSIFKITPLKQLTEFGLGRILQVSLIAGYSFALYEKVQGIKGKPSAAEIAAIAYYTTSIAYRVALVGGGILFPVSATTVGIISIASLGCGVVKIHLEN